MNAQLKVKIQKKAWTEIKQIQDADNMMTVEHAISNAILKTFSLWNIGLRKIQARKSGTLERFEMGREINEKLFCMYGKEVKQYLITLIPERMTTSLMYKNLIK